MPSPSPTPTPIILKILESADGWLVFDPPVYLKSWHPPTGQVVLTGNRAEAYRFLTATAALDSWKFVNLSEPLRVDGRPNRPLTAFTVSPEPYDGPQ